MIWAARSTGLSAAVGHNVVVVVAAIVVEVDKDDGGAVVELTSDVDDVSMIGLPDPVTQATSTRGNSSASPSLAMIERYVVPADWWAT